MWKIVGTYRGNSEVIDEFETEEEAKKMLAEYQLAFGPEWSMIVAYEKGG